MIANLSKNLSMAEMLVTSTGLPNMAPDYIEWKLFIMAQFLFQRIRDQFGWCTVTSGYRSPQVNKRVGGQIYSQHAKGEAMDIIPRDASCEEVFKWIIENLRFGQVIWEKVGSKEWIHISMIRATEPNQEAWTYDGSAYELYEDGE